METRTIKKRTKHALTREYCESVARQCKTTIEFWKEHRSVAQKAQAEGWYDSYTWLQRIRVKRNTYTEEECRIAAMKCKSIREFREKHTSAYVTSVRHGWLKDFNWLTRELARKTYWTVDTVTAEAKKYTTKKAFREGCPLAYNYACHHGFIAAFDWLMEVRHEK